jgi:CheY-like chemotaxis protein
VRQASVFLVEDNVLIRMMFAAMVEELGHRVVAQAGTVQEARTLAELAAFDLALLDINLNGESVAPIAEIIETRGLPYAFVSSYDTRGLPELFGRRPLLQKPFEISKLGALIAKMLELGQGR